MLEQLEGRIVPSTDQWTGDDIVNGNQNWSDGQNWSRQHPPGPNDTAVFLNNTTVHGFGPIVDVPFTIRHLTIEHDSPPLKVGASLTVTSGLTLAGGTIEGDGAISVSGNSKWTDGYLIVGAGGFVNHGTLTLSGSNQLILEGSGTLTNLGTIAQANSGGLSMSGNDSGPTTLANAAGATYDFQADSGIAISTPGGGTFTNAGTLSKSAGTGTSVVDTNTFVNSGTVDVTSGTLALQGGNGTSTGGNFLVSAGATLDLTNSGSANNYTGTYTGSGAGTVALSGGILNVAPGGATFDFPAGMFQWTGGDIELSDTLTNTATGLLTLSGSNPKALIGSGTLLNQGTINQGGTGMLNMLGSGSGPCVLSNQAGATYDFQADSGISFGSPSGGNFNNAGTLTKTGGTGTSAVDPVNFNNSGTVAVHTGTLNVQATVAQVSGTSLTGGSWEAFGSKTVPATLTISSAPDFTTLAKGVLAELSGPNSAFTNLAGLNSLGGRLEVLGGQSLTTTGDLTVTGSGSLDVGANSTMTVAGNFDLTSKATLQIGLGGSNSTPTIGRLLVTGTVALSGKYKMTASSQPAIGSMFTILDNQGNAPVSGTFVGLPEGATVTINGMTFQISYAGGDGNDVVLTRTA